MTTIKSFYIKTLISIGIHQFCAHPALVWEHFTLMDSIKERNRKRQGLLTNLSKTKSRLKLPNELWKKYHQGNPKFWNLNLNLTCNIESWFGNCFTPLSSHLHAYPHKSLFWAARSSANILTLLSSLKGRIRCNK